MDRQRPTPAQQVCCQLSGPTRGESPEYEDPAAVARERVRDVLPKLSTVTLSENRRDDRLLEGQHPTFEVASGHLMCQLVRAA